MWWISVGMLLLKSFRSSKKFNDVLKLNCLQNRKAFTKNKAWGSELSQHCPKEWIPPRFPSVPHHTRRCFLWTLGINWDIPCPFYYGKLADKDCPLHYSPSSALSDCCSAGMRLIFAHSHAQIWKMQQKLRFLRDWNLQFSSQNSKGSNSPKNEPNWAKMVSNERGRFKERLGRALSQQNVWFTCNVTILILAFQQPWNIVNLL